MSKNVSSENKTKIIYTFVFPVTMCRYKSWAVKMAARKKTYSFKMLEEGSMDTLDYHRDEQVGPRTN